MDEVLHFLLIRFLMIGAGVVALIMLVFVLALIWRRTGR
jgi:hypothetical protein